jgi:hypothetical protein
VAWIEMVGVVGVKIKKEKEEKIKKSFTDAEFFI